MEVEKIDIEGTKTEAESTTTTFLRMFTPIFQFPTTKKQVKKKIYISRQKSSINEAPRNHLQRTSNSSIEKNVQHELDVQPHSCVNANAASSIDRQAKQTLDVKSFL